MSERKKTCPILYIQSACSGINAWLSTQRDAKNQPENCPILLYQAAGQEGQLAGWEKRLVGWEDYPTREELAAAAAAVDANRTFLLQTHGESPT